MSAEIIKQRLIDAAKKKGEKADREKAEKIAEAWMGKSAIKR